MFFSSCLSDKSSNCEAVGDRYGGEGTIKTYDRNRSSTSDCDKQRLLGMVLLKVIHPFFLFADSGSNRLGDVSD